MFQQPFKAILSGLVGVGSGKAGGSSFDQLSRGCIRRRFADEILFRVKDQNFCSPELASGRFIVEGVSVGEGKTIARLRWNWERRVRIGRVERAIGTYKQDEKLYNAESKTQSEGRVWRASEAADDEIGGRCLLDFGWCGRRDFTSARNGPPLRLDLDSGGHPLFRRFGTVEYKGTTNFRKMP